MLLRLAYLGITNAFALLRLLPRTDREKDAEILALRHQLAVLQRHLDGSGSASTRPTGPGWPRCCTHSPGPPCTVCGCWYGRTRSCAGTVICSRAATRQHPGPDGEADRAPCSRSADWCYGW